VRWGFVTTGILVVIALLVVVTPAGAAPGEVESGDIPRSGISLIRWSGGSIAQLETIAAARGCGLRTAWATGADGRLAGYVVGAPALVNEQFNSLYGLSLPAGIALLIVCQSIPLPQTSAPTVTPTPTPTLTPTPTPTPEASQFHLSGEMTPFTDGEFLFTVNVSQSRDSGTVGQVHRITEVCVGSRSTVGSCYLLQPQLGEEQYRILLPAAGSPGWVRVRVCWEGGCGPYYFWGVASQVRSGEMYVVSSAYSTGVQVYVYALMAGITRASVMLSGGGTADFRCGGAIRTCGNEFFPGDHSSVTVTLHKLQGPPSTYVVELK